MAKMSKSFGAQHAAKPHLVAGGGGLSGEIVDLRNDVETAFKYNEARNGFPELDWLDPGVLLAEGQDLVLRGRNLLQGQTFDSLTLGTGTAQLDLVLLKPGDSGFRAKVVQGTGSLAVTFTGGLLTVTLAAAGSTSNEVATAINSLTACIGVVFATGHGAGNMVVADETPLVGGTGLYTGNRVLVSGVECLPKHQILSWEDGVITVTVPDLTALTPARAATDIVGIVIQSDGVTTNQLSAVLS